MTSTRSAMAISPTDSAFSSGLLHRFRSAWVHSFSSAALTAFFVATGAVISSSWVGLRSSLAPATTSVAEAAAREVPRETVVPRSPRAAPTSAVAPAAEISARSISGTVPGSAPRTPRVTTDAVARTARGPAMTMARALEGMVRRALGSRTWR